MKHHWTCHPNTGVRQLQVFPVEQRSDTAGAALSHWQGASSLTVTTLETKLYVLSPVDLKQEETNLCGL